MLLVRAETLDILDEIEWITRGSRKGAARLHLSPAPTGPAKGGIVGDARTIH